MMSVTTRMRASSGWQLGDAFLERSLCFRLSLGECVAEHGKATNRFEIASLHSACRSLESNLQCDEKAHLRCSDTSDHCTARHPDNNFRPYRA